MNQKELSPKGWVIGTLVLSLSMLVCMAMFVYEYDPFCYYRIPDDRLIINNYRFVNAGIAKNAEYDTAIIGSSMTQNFHMDKFREELDMSPVKLSVGGMSVEGTTLTYKQLIEIGKVENLIFCIDIPSLNKDVDNLETYATYLYNENELDDYKYLLGYETWMRLLPLNIGFNVLEKMGIQIPSSYGTHAIDTIGEWDADAKYGEKYLKKQYLEGTHQVSSQNLDEASERMKRNVDVLLAEIFSKRNEQEIIFFFPPYSALYWHGAQQQGYFEMFQEIKKYIVEKAVSVEGIRVFDFQSIPQIADLDNYKDISHYSAELNDLMVEWIAAEEYLVNTQTVEDHIGDLRSRVLEFVAQTEWVN